MPTPLAWWHGPPWSSKGLDGVYFFFFSSDTVVSGLVKERLSSDCWRIRSWQSPTARRGHLPHVARGEGEGICHRDEQSPEADQLTCLRAKQRGGRSQRQKRRHVQGRTGLAWHRPQRRAWAALERAWRSGRTCCLCRGLCTWVLLSSERGCCHHRAKPHSAGVQEWTGQARTLP